MLTMLMYHRTLPQEHPEAVSVPMFRRQLIICKGIIRFWLPKRFWIMFMADSEMRHALTPHSLLTTAGSTTGCLPRKF